MSPPLHPPGLDVNQATLVAPTGTTHSTTATQRVVYLVLLQNLYDPGSRTGTLTMQAPCGASYVATKVRGGHEGGQLEEWVYSLIKPWVYSLIKPWVYSLIKPWGFSMKGEARLRETKQKLV